MFKEILSRTDLTPSQSEILEFLYQNKEAKASEVAKNIRKSRTIVYKDLEELEQMGLIEKKEKTNQVALFSATHPSLLKNLLDKKEEQIKKDQELLDNYLPKILSSFNLAHNRPGIRFFEGAEGMKKIYEEILEEGKDFHLIRTAYEPVYNDKIAPIVEEFIAKRVRKNIKVTAMIPSDVDDPKKDARWLMKRFNVEKEKYTAPVEIDIFGNKVAILSFGDELVGMIIESRQIAQSLKQLFALAAMVGE
jgi:HTH-type transcriptional regulator, sugar sensing transcriptional regulator